MIDPLERWAQYGEKPDYAGLLTFAGMPCTQDPAERQQPRVVGLLAVLRPAVLRIDHGPSLSTLMVSNAGSLAPCSRAPLPASSRR